MAFRMSAGCGKQWWRGDWADVRLVGLSVGPAIEQIMETSILVGSHRIVVGEASSKDQVGKAEKENHESKHVCSAAACPGRVGVWG